MDGSCEKEVTRMDDKKTQNTKSAEFADELNMDGKNKKSGQASTSNNSSNTTNCR